jgi:hypothetical protein
MVIGLGFISCAAERQSFKPTEKVGGETVEGFKEAFYDLGSDSKRVGEVKVWSRGAYLDKRAGMDVTVIHLGFTIENKGDTPIEFNVDDVELESVQTKVGNYEHVAVMDHMGPTAVAPKSSETIELTFALPKKVTPDEILAFRTRWTTKAEGAEYTEFTPFVQQQQQRYAYVPVYGYYYPYYPFDYPYYGPFYYPRARVIIVRPYPRRVIVRSHRSSSGTGK